MLLRPKMVRSRGNGDQGVKIVVPQLVFLPSVILLHLWKTAEFLLFKMSFAGRLELTPADFSSERADQRAPGSDELQNRLLEL